MAEGGDGRTVEFENTTYDTDDIDRVDTNDNDAIAPEQSLGDSASQPDSLQKELLEEAVDSYYNALAEKGVTPGLGRNYNQFVLGRDGRLRLREFPGVDIVNARDGRPLALSTVAGRRRGREAVRVGLGFVDWAEKVARPGAISALQRTNEKLGEAAAKVEAIELQDLSQVGKEASDAVQQLETTLTDADIDQILSTVDDSPLNLREIRGLDRALQRVRGELVNNLAKLSELDDHIALEKRKLGEAVDESDRHRVAERLRNLQDERASRLEAASANREALRSQINRIRETISRVLNEDTTLAERIRTLFREQGITIASILTALGMAISTLVLALTGGTSGGAPSPPPAPSDKGGLKEWVKKHLQSLGRILAKLAGKAAAALPGIIGSIVSWLLSTLGKAASWLADNLWAAVLAIGGLLLVAARDKLSSN